VLMEFDYPDLYSPLDLGIGRCRMSLAAPKDFAADEALWNDSHIRVATKYTNITKKYFAARGIQAECVKLNGAVELAPKLGLSQRIVDLVSSGATLKANGLVEVETIAEVTSRLIVNRGAFKTMGSDITSLVDGFTEAVHGASA
jgi:ATP phosphoribosyltransferase